MFRRGDSIERRLSRERPEPPQDVVDRLVSRIEADRAPAGHVLRRRLAPALAMTATLAGALVAFGGVGYAQSTVESTAEAVVRTAKSIVVSRDRQASPAPSGYVAASQTYAPTVTCNVSFQGAKKKVRVSGTTTLASGTINVVVTENGSPFWSKSVSATLLWDTGNGPDTTSGRTYTANVTQTGSGFPNGTATCWATSP